MKATKVSQIIKTINQLSIEKNKIELEKHFSIIIRQYFNLENFASF